MNKQSMPRLIAVCGLKRSGKDTVSDYISQHFGYQKIKIAQNLKDMLKAAFGFTDEQLETDLKDEVDPKWGVSPRLVMQFMGTNIMQHEIQKIVPNVGRTFWIKRMVDQYLDGDETTKYIISDLRFMHEYEMIKKYNPLIIRVERSNLSYPLDIHPSETEHKNIPCDLVIENNRTLEHLFKDLSKYLANAFNDEVNQI
jgi:dephospho-CoA kinase